MQANLINSSFQAEVFEALPESVYYKNKEGTYLTCSHRAAQLAGLQRASDLIGKTDHDLFWADHADVLRANDLRVMETGQTMVFEERAHTVDPAVQLIRTVKSPFLDSEGNIAGVVGISFNLTDLLDKSMSFRNKVAADKAMARVESNFLKKWYQEVSGQIIAEDLSLDDIGNHLKTYMEGIIDKLPANIYWMGLDGRMLGCNQQMAEVLGCKDRNELIGQYCQQYYEQYQASAAQDNNSQALQHSEVLVTEESAIFDGEEKIFLSHKSPLRDKEGKAISLVGVSFDITERKRIERELKIAKEQAEAANLAKLHFMNNMRHDIRTPLSCVVGSARILKSLENDPEKAEFIEGILKSSENLLQMLTNMLEFNHIQSQERTVEFTPVKITKLAQDLVDMLQITAKGKGLDLSISVAPGTLEQILSDGYRLQRVLLNLMSNAIKFTHQGSVTLNIETQGKYLLISVKDTGIGFSLEHKHKVFDKFVRLVSSDKGLYEGEGLGLSIVKQFADELNARIEVESEEGVGSSFTLFLPI